MNLFKTLQLLLLSICFSTISLAQQAGNWQIGLRFSPEFCYRSIDDTEGSLYGYWTSEGRNKVELPQFGLTTGLRVGYLLGDHLSIETGLQYQHRGYHTKRNQYIMPAVNAQPLGYVTYSRDYHSLGIPLGLNYTIGQKKLRVLLSLNAAADYIVRAKSVSKMEGPYGVDIDNSPDRHLRKFNIYATGGCGVEYAYSEIISFRAEAVYRRSMMKIGKPVMAIYEPKYLWNSGIDFGIYYKI